MRTYYGSFTDINESDIIAIFGNYRFYFTTNFNKTKFIENVEYFTRLEEVKITNRYGIEIDLRDYLAIWYYKKVQKRGFRVEKLENRKKINNFKFEIFNKYE